MPGLHIDAGFFASRAAWTCVVLILSGCSWQADTRPDAGVPVTSVGQRAAEVALNMVGTPYRYGGRSPRGFDCSGLVHFAFGQAGRDVPRTSKAQYAAARPVSLHEARPGDLVFFSGWRSISHVGIYLGNRQFVHAPSSGKRVTVTSLNTDYYRDRLVTIARL